MKEPTIRAGLGRTTGGIFFLTLFLLGIGACAKQHDALDLTGKDVKLTFLHTSDMHSRLFPFRMKVIYTDEQMGLEQKNEPFGGFARLAHLIHRERQQNERVLYLDTGDFFQGAPVFNAFHGEAEVRAMSYLAPDATVIGNHEFDSGLENLTTQLQRWATFPVLAANYLFVPGNALGDIAKPYDIVQVGGLKVGIIGVANFSSLSSITDVGNSLGIVPINIEQTVQYWIDMLDPMVDLIVLNSHAGYSTDEHLIRCTQGADLLFGGHTHLALLPPKVIKDAAGRDVIITHSGAFAKYLGKLDVVVRDGDVVAHSYELTPIDSTIGEDPKMVELLEPYRLALNQTWDLTSIFGYTGKLLTKYGFEGGDSSLGNLVAEAMRKYARVDIGFNNTLGIRANIYPGPITFEDLFNVFPFENTVTTMIMSGADLQVLFDYNTERSAGRGCNSQLQVAGVEFTMDCNHAPAECSCWHERQECPGNPQFDELYLSPQKCEPYDEHPLTDVCREACECPEGATEVSDCRCPPMARDIFVTSCSDPMITDTEGCKKEPLRLDALYEVATNDYIAKGGSGFIMLRSNNTQVDTGVPIREAVMERIITSGQCQERCLNDHGRIRVRDCSTYLACVEQVEDFAQQFCNDVDLENEAAHELPEHCVVAGPGTCRRDEHCYDIAALCDGGPGCPTCNNPSQCDEGETCTNGHCVPDQMVCFDGHCRVRCELDEDCQPEPLLPDRFQICIGGVCEVPYREVCMDDGECAHGTAMCLAGQPTCLTDTECDGDAGMVCRMGYCQPDRSVCASNADCDDDVVCAFGYCDPLATPCDGDADCAEGACVRGACNDACGNCAFDTDCPSGLVCSENFCVPPSGRCVGHRCRARCTDDASCPVDASCRDGECLPEVCAGVQSPETNCRLNVSWKTVERCLEVPCARSEVDGRIKRLLPENLGGVHTKQPVINDPEDIHPDYLGDGGVEGEGE